LGVGTAAGVATGIAGLGIQGAQQAQLSKQIADQEQITALQMKLAQFQIKQFEDQEKLLKK